ncbi:MAG: nuclear transport factor 2 family protein, partial [Actinomycetales bacterium]
EAAAQAIVTAFAANDDPEYFEKFSPDAVFVFHTTPNRLRTRAAYEQEMAAWRSEAGFRVISCQSDDPQVLMLGDDAAVFVHDVHTTLSMDGAVHDLRERETIAFHRTDGNWIAVHEHLSPQPQE